MAHWRGLVASALTVALALAATDADCLWSPHVAVSLLQAGIHHRGSRGSLKQANATNVSAHKNVSAYANVSAYQLNDGHSIPAIGFGTYSIQPGEATYAAVKSALVLGYRMFDTAMIHGNEADVGRAIRDSGIPRSELFVTTKVFNTDHGYQRALSAGRQSNALLGLGYIDMLLIHSPLGLPQGKIVETYDALLKLQEEGVVRSVGVSNFGVTHLQALADYCRPTPAVNQFELHPLVYNSRKELVDYCRDKGILVQPYGSLLTGDDTLLQLRDLQSIADAHRKFPAQVLLRWALDQGFQIIPISSQREHQEENFDILDFALSQQEILKLNAVQADMSGIVSQGGEITKYWDPLNAPVDVGSVGPRPSSCPARTQA